MKFLLFIFAIVLSSCATAPTPYQRADRDGGFSEKKVGESSWLVTFHGNWQTSMGYCEDMAFKRSEELCKENGFTGFELIKEEKRAVPRFGFMTTLWEKVLTVHISCSKKAETVKKAH